LPNVVGTFNVMINCMEGSGGVDVSGAFTRKAYGNQGAGADGATGNNFTFNASRCSTLYGSSTTVTPESLAVSWFIKF
jgi:hypothetical protein